MVKTPKMRHSRPRREPLTIELGPDAVARVDQTVEEADRPQVDDVAADELSPDRQRAETAGFGEPEREAEPETVYQAASSESGNAERAQASGERNQPDLQPSGPPARGGGFSRIVAGVIGGVVALAVAGLLQFLGLLGAPGAGDGGQATRAEIEALAARVATVEQGTQGGVDGSRVDALEQALDAVRAEVAAVGQQAGGADPAVLQALEQRMKTIEDAVAQLRQGGGGQQPADVTGLVERVATLETGLKAVTDAAGQGEARLAALEQSIAGLASRLDTQAEQPKIALAIATAALRAAIERGAPFAGELDTIAAIAPQSPEIAALRPYAERGAPTRQTLIEEMPAAADRMIAASRPVDSDAGFFDRLLQSAESLVTVRPIGSVEGTSVAAIVARMEVALKAGDLNAAVAEFDTLPEEVKASVSDFAERLKARLTVETLADQAISAAMRA